MDFFLGFDWKETFTVTMILFAVIDILGSIPIIVDLRTRVGHIQSEKASIVGLRFKTWGVFAIFVFYANRRFIKVIAT